MTRVSRSVTLAVSALLLACSSGDASTENEGQPPKPGRSFSGGRISQDQRWEDGTSLTGPVEIQAGVTVTIAAGAVIGVAERTSVNVAGVLRVETGPTHAKIAGPAWVGLSAVRGGKLDLDGLDIQNAQVAVDIQEGSEPSRYDNGVVGGEGAPFLVGRGAKLTTQGVTVSGTSVSSFISGTLEAKRLDMHVVDADEGLITDDPSAVLIVEDSKFSADPGANVELIASYDGAKTINISYTELVGGHCSFHFSAVTDLKISYVTMREAHFGLMMYGSDKTGGTRTVENSNFVKNVEYGIDETEGSQNGAVSVTGCFFEGNGLGNTKLLPGSPIQVGSNASAQVGGAKPR